MSFRPYNYSYTYNKGILVERRGGFAIYGWTGVVNITLIDTSIPELKSKLGLGEAGAETQQPQEQPVPLYWIIFLIAIPVVSGVAAYMTAKRRRQRKGPSQPLPCLAPSEGNELPGTHFYHPLKQWSI